jgi:hypothetical protein
MALSKLVEIIIMTRKRKILENTISTSLMISIITPLGSGSKVMI